jgi:hypothetical protein
VRADDVICAATAAQESSADKKEGPGVAAGTFFIVDGR